MYDTKLYRAWMDEYCKRGDDNSRMNDEDDVRSSVNGFFCGGEVRRVVENGEAATTVALR